MLLQPLFVDSGSEHLFCMHGEPSASSVVSGGVVLLPAFAEEMNRTRSFSSRTAARLTEAGFLVVQPDLSGTGDSTGDFRDATWEKWLSELQFISLWLAQKTKPLHIVTVRTGSLFLQGLLERQPALFDKVCMVEPFLSGAEYVATFLQLRVARSIFEGSRESVATLTAELRNGVSLEVGGYEFSPGMHDSLCQSSIEAIGEKLRGQVLAIGCGRSENSKRNINAGALIESWKHGGVSADYKFIETDPFWSQELPTIPRDVIVEIAAFLAGSE